MRPGIWGSSEEVFQGKFSRRSNFEQPTVVSKRRRRMPVRTGGLPTVCGSRGGVWLVVVGVGIGGTF